MYRWQCLSSCQPYSFYSRAFLPRALPVPSSSSCPTCAFLFVVPYPRLPPCAPPAPASGTTMSSSSSSPSPLPTAPSRHARVSPELHEQNPSALMTAAFFPSPSAAATTLSHPPTISTAWSICLPPNSLLSSSELKKKSGLPIETLVATGVEEEKRGENSALTMDSAESTAAAAARAPNGAARAVDDYDDDDDDAVPEVAACISAMLDLGGSVESKRLFLARRTALEMLRDRGYAVPEDELARTLPEFRAWWEDKPELERLAFSTTLASDPSSKVKVVFCPPEPVKIAAIRVVYTGVKDENLSRLILILQGRIMSKAREAIKEIFPYKVDTFQITELLVNITKHALKPKHQVLTAEEKAKLLKEYNVVDSQLPRMLENDAVARYYGLGKGTVVKVIYDSELTGNHVTYRCIF